MPPADAVFVVRDRLPIEDLDAVDIDPAVVDTGKGDHLLVSSSTVALAAAEVDYLAVGAELDLAATPEVLAQHHPGSLDA